ncbi:hypothetical protein ACLOJK_022719 [Asimina triloba]
MLACPRDGREWCARDGSRLSANGAWPWTLARGFLGVMERGRDGAAAGDGDADGGWMKVDRVALQPAVIEMEADGRRGRWSCYGGRGLLSSGVRLAERLDGRRWHGR